MNIAIFGNGKSVLELIQWLLKNDIGILNVEQDFVLDEHNQELFEAELRNFSIPLNSFSSINRDQISLVLVMNYNRIIPENTIEGIIAVNIHMGILPKYRGNNANAWAVFNGEQEVGYTIHLVNNSLDAGDIFYTFRYNRSEDKTYQAAKTAILEDIQDNVSAIIKRIYKGDMIPISQDRSKFMYCAKLRPSDGIISDWNRETEDIFNLFYVFARPLGTGLKFRFKGKLYEIGKINRINDYSHSIGVPGSIVYMTTNALWVKTKDTAIEISELKCDDVPVVLNLEFKIGFRF